MGAPPHASRLRRFVRGVVFLAAGAGVFPQTQPEQPEWSVLQSIRQHETASFNTIKAGLDERAVEYTERDLLAEYGVFGKSLVAGNVVSQEHPFLFVFPVYECHTELAFSLLDAAGADPSLGFTFMGDVFSVSNAAFNDLFESLDYPENALLLYLSRTEDGSLAVTFFQEAVKNPFHLTEPFARYLEARNIPFSFLEKPVTGKTVVITPDAFPDTNTLAACLLGFAATNPRPETDGDTYYIAADVRGRKIILSNPAVLRIVVASSAALLFVSLFFAVLFYKKRVFVLTLTVFFAFAAVMLLGNPLRRQDNRDSAALLAGIPGATPRAMPQDGLAAAEPTIEAKKTVFLDRITYTIKAEYPHEPYRIALCYDYETRADGLPGEAYEAPFPYEAEEGRITFILGEYPPNPLETEISFPRTLPGALSITAVFAPDDDAVSLMWREEETAHGL